MYDTIVSLWRRRRDYSSCADFTNRIFGVMASALHQRRALGILEPVVGLAFTRMTPHVCVFLGWLADGEDDGFELPRVHIAVPRAFEVQASPSAVFDLCDPEDVFRLGTYLLSLKEQVASISDACSSLHELQTLSNPDGYRSKAETVARIDSSMHSDDVPIDAWARKVCRSDLSVTGLDPSAHSLSSSTFTPPPKDDSLFIRDVPSLKGTASPPGKGADTRTSDTSFTANTSATSDVSLSCLSPSEFANEASRENKNLFWHIGRASLPYSVDPVTTDRATTANCDSGPTPAHVSAYKAFTGPSYPHLVWQRLNDVPAVHDSSLQGLRETLFKQGTQRNALLGSKDYRLPPLRAASSEDIFRDFKNMAKYFPRILSISQMAGGLYEAETRRAFDNMLELCFDSPKHACKTILERELNFCANTGALPAKDLDADTKFTGWLIGLVNDHRLLSELEAQTLMEDISKERKKVHKVMVAEWEVKHPRKPYPEPILQKDRDKDVDKWIHKKQKPKHSEWDYRVVRSQQKLDAREAATVAYNELFANGLDMFREAEQKEPMKGKCDAICIASFAFEGKQHSDPKDFNLLLVPSSDGSQTRALERFDRQEYRAPGTIKNGDTFVPSYDSGVEHRPWIAHSVPTAPAQARVLPPRTQEASNTSGVDALSSQLERLNIKDRDAKYAILDLPLLIAEYKKPSEGAGYFANLKSGNQDRMHLVSAVQYLEALGITDFPVFGMITEGPRASIISAMLATTKDGKKLEYPYIERLEHDVRNYNIDDPLEAFEFAHFIRKLVRVHVPALGEKLRLAARKWPDGLVGLKPWSMRGVYQARAEAVREEDAYDEEGDEQTEC